MTRERLRATAAAFLITLSFTTLGQPNSPEPALEEIIVTATKREVALMDLPMSVGVVTEQVLRDLGAVSIDDVWRQVPNLAVRDAPFGGRAFIIRGLSDTDSFLSTESINAFYIDDTPVTHVGGLFSSPADSALLDLQRVEVLRGPQGTLVGANAMGGAIRMITNPPVLESAGIEVEARMSHTREGGWNYGGQLVRNQPTGPDSALRLALLYQDDDGFIDDIGLGREDVNGQERTAGRISWLWQPSEDWEVLARLYLEEVDTSGYNYADNVGRPWLGLLTTSEYQVVLFTPEEREEDLLLASVEFTRRFPWGEFQSSTSWYEKDLGLVLDWSVEAFFFFALDHPAFGGNDFDQQDFSQELRFSSTGEDRFNWLVGTFFLDQSQDNDEFLFAENLREPFCLFPGACFEAGETIVLVDSLTRSKRQDLAVFGEASWRFSDRLEGVAGLRWYRSERDQLITGGGIFPAPGTAAGRSDGVVPKVSLSWDVNEQSMVYGLVSQGFRPGQFNNPASINVCGSRPVIDDDELTNFELGLKHESSDGRFRFDASAFRIDWDDMQFNAYTADCPFPVLENVAQSTSTGVEMGFSWVVGNGLSLQGGLGYNDARLDSEFITESINIPSGTPIPNVPEWTAKLAGTWEFGWTAGVSGYVRADAQYVDDRTVLFDPNSFPTYPEIDAYTLVDLRVGAERGPLRGELFVTNVFDERAELFCCRNFTDPTVNRPRTLGARAIWRFD